MSEFRHGSRGRLLARSNLNLQLDKYPSSGDLLAAITTCQLEKREVLI